MTLSQLPPELLLRVTYHLTTPELGYLRRTCKQIEHLLFSSFAREFFTKRQFMVEEISLQALVDIANHPTLSPWLSEVIFSLNGLPVEAPNSRSRIEVVKEMQKHGHQSSELLLATGKACNMIVEAFGKLTNLKTVNFRDYSARGRTRDGDGSWRSYGWSYNGVLREADYHRSFALVNHTIFPMVLHALGRAQARPGSIEVFLRKRTPYGVGLPPTTFGFSKTTVEPLIENVLQGLKTLMLTIAEPYEPEIVMNPLNWRPQLAPRHATVNPHDNIYEAPLRLLLRRTPNLTTLRLNFDPEQWYGYNFLHWLGQPTSISEVPFANLTGLDLGMVKVERSTLLQVITKPKNLTSLNLWKVCIFAVQSIADLGLRAESSWSILLTDLAEALSATCPLTFMLIGFPSETLADSDLTVPTRFVDPAYPIGMTGDPRGILDKVSYRGSDLKQWLEDTADNAIREPVLLEGSTPTGDEFDDDDDDDDPSDDLDDDDISEEHLTEDE